MNKIQSLKILVEQAESEGYDFYKKNNLTAGTRYRQLLTKVKCLAQEIRMETLEQKKAIAYLRYRKNQK